MALGRQPGPATRAETGGDDDAATDVLAPHGVPRLQRANLHSANPPGHLNGEIKRRSEVASLTRRREAPHCPNKTTNGPARTLAT